MSERASAAARLARTVLGVALTGAAESGVLGRGSQWTAPSGGRFAHQRWENARGCAGRRRRRRPTRANGARDRIGGGGEAHRDAVQGPRAQARARARVQA